MAKSPPKPKSLSEAGKLLLSGFFMGASDVVPGISGGTMAFVLGIYENFILSISSFSSSALIDLACFRIKTFFQKTAWQYLGLIVIGIITAIATLAPLINSLLNEPNSREYLYSLFLGLILVTILLCFNKVNTWKNRYLLFFLIGASLALLLTNWEPEPTENFYELPLPKNLTFDQSLDIINYSPQKKMLLSIRESQLAKMLARDIIPPSYPVFSISEGKMGEVGAFVGKTGYDNEYLLYFSWGIIGVSAMLLPGISGSYMLLIIGAYPIVISTISAFVLSLKSGSFDLSSFGLLAALGSGIIIGALLFSRVIQFALKWHHDTTMMTLAGFMVGAIGTVWPFWSYQNYFDPIENSIRLIPIDPQLPVFFSLHFLFALLFFFLGIFLITFNQFLAFNLKK